VLKELISIFKDDQPLQKASNDFALMLTLAEEMIVEASAVFWGKHHTPEERTALYKKDIKINKLERSIRKEVVAHVSGPVPNHVPYALLLISLVKDAERLGDYAKNLVEVNDLSNEPLPNDECVKELREIANSVETLAGEAARVFADSNAQRATELTVEHRGISKRCDRLYSTIVETETDVSVAVRLTLGARFYKRIASHTLNLLSGLIMPLHKVDYFDEDLLDSPED
jgi:phosphate uptake regulator